MRRGIEQKKNIEWKDIISNNTLCSTYSSWIGETVMKISDEFRVFFKAEAIYILLAFLLPENAASHKCIIVTEHWTNNGWVKVKTDEPQGRAASRSSTYLTVQVF